MAAPASSPALVLRELGERSPDVRAAILLDGPVLAACEPPDDDLGGRLAEQARALLDAADRADEGPVAEVEVVTPVGAVYAVRDGAATLAVVAGRLALSSLARYDLRRALIELRDGSR